MKLELTKEEAREILWRRKVHQGSEDAYKDLLAQVREFEPKARLTHTGGAIQVRARRGVLIFHVHRFNPREYSCYILKGRNGSTGIGNTAYVAFMDAVVKLRSDYETLGNLLDELELEAK